jgi:hypothetical protein
VNKVGVTYEVRFRYYEYQDYPNGGPGKGRKVCQEEAEARTLLTNLRRMLERQGKGSAWLEREFGLSGFLTDVVGIYRVEVTKIT